MSFNMLSNTFFYSFLIVGGKTKKSRWSIGNFSLYLPLLRRSAAGHPALVSSCFLFFVFLSLAIGMVIHWTYYLDKKDLFPCTRKNPGPRTSRFHHVHSCTLSFWDAHLLKCKRSHTQWERQTWAWTLSSFHSEHDNDDAPYWWF